MTPMVDVVMVILIFFMASAAIMGPEWFLRSTLPIAKPGPAADAKESIKVRAVMVRDGQTTMLELSIDSNPKNRVPIPQFDAFLRDQLVTHRAEQIIVLIMPEADVPYDDIVHVHEMTQKLGIRQVGLYEAPGLLTPAAPLDSGASPK